MEMIWRDKNYFELAGVRVIEGSSYSTCKCMKEIQGKSIFVRRGFEFKHGSQVYLLRRVFLLKIFEVLKSLNSE